MGLFDFLGLNKNQGPQSKEAYFLSEDDAKSFGDIDFMRKEVVVRRTFAKKKGQTEELESVKSISSSNSRAVGETTKPVTTTFSSTFRPPVSAEPSSATPESAPATPEPTPASTPSESAISRARDTGMDMFRDMAKNLRR